MKMIGVAAAAAALLGVTAAPAQALYVQGGGGVSFDPSLDYNHVSYPMKTGWNAGGSIGTDLFFPGLALQGDVFYTHSRYSCCTSSLSSLSVMGDLVYNFELPGVPLTPYVGAGIGAADTRYSDPAAPAFSGSQWAFAWQAIAGARWQVAPTFSIYGEYRYQGASNVTIKGEPDIGNQSNSLTFGVRFDLP